MAKIFNFPTKNEDEIQIQDASHGVCDSPRQQLKNCLTENKYYELLYINGDYYIVDDIGNYTTYYLTEKGALY